jgi:hypothetical protein
MPASASGAGARCGGAWYLQPDRPRVRPTARNPSETRIRRTIHTIHDEDPPTISSQSPSEPTPPHGDLTGLPSLLASSGHLSAPGELIQLGAVKGTEREANRASFGAFDR